MLKNKKFVVMLVIFLLGVGLLAGCGADAGGESDFEWDGGLTDSADEEQAMDKGETIAPTGEVEEEAIGTQATATANGTLKTVSVADGTVTIADKSGDELVLMVTSESKLIIGESLANLTELATKVDSGVSVEYHAETKTVTAIIIEG